MRNDALRLKQSRGWFAATSSFREAIEKLSDGAFKLFACVCLDADRPTGRLRAFAQRSGLHFVHLIWPHLGLSIGPT